MLDLPTAMLFRVPMLLRSHKIQIYSVHTFARMNTNSMKKLALFANCAAL